MNKKRRRFAELRRNARGLKRFLKASRKRRRKIIFVNHYRPKVEIHTNREDKTSKKKGDKNQDGSPKLPEVLDYLINQRAHSFTNKQTKVPQNGILYVPEYFSISQYPDQSFFFLKQLILSLHLGKKKTVQIDYRRCKEIDLGASICFDVILKEYRSFYSNPNFPNNKRKEVRAINLTNPSTIKFLQTIGVYRTLKAFDTANKFPDTITFDLIEGRQNQGIGEKEIHGTLLVEYLEKCLDKMGKFLNQDSKENLATIFGEVFANSEDHSSLKVRYAIGYFDKIQHGESSIGKFQFVIFNWGQSIYERLTDDKYCLNTSIRDEMSLLSKKYTEEGWLRSPKFKEETLWTLYALQDGVSSIAKDRGSGTINFIENFFDLKGEDNNDSEDSRMYLYSGNTRIIFDGKYRTEYKENNEGETHKIIAFNSKNSIFEPPDEKFVTFVPNYFPGTMIYAKIFIKPENLTENGQ